MPIDNIEGVLNRDVSQAYSEFLTQQARFTFQDLSRADAIFGKSKLAYKKLVEDPEVLAQVARQYRIQTLIRTRIQKEGAIYRFDLEWLLAPRMELIGSQSLRLDESDLASVPPGENLRIELRKTLELLIEKVPFIGNVTGRDGKQVTVNIGKKSNLKGGDLLAVQTLDDVRKHPILKTIVGWALTDVGTLEVVSTDEGVAFCKIDTELKERKIEKNQKIARVIPKVVIPERIDEGFPPEYETQVDTTPKLGSAGFSAHFGQFSRQVGTIDNTSGKTGSGLYFGGKIDGELWMTRSIFLDADFSLGTASYLQTDIKTGLANEESVSLTLSQFRFHPGYYFHLTDSFFGPKLGFRLGFHSTSWTLPSSPQEQTGPSYWRGVFIGTTGELPLDEKWGARLTFDYGLFDSYSESPVSFGFGPANSTRTYGFNVGGFYKITDRIVVRAGLEWLSQNAEFAEGQTLNHKTISFAPTILYYF